jgi:hypothetical protein
VVGVACEMKAKDCTKRVEPQTVRAARPCGPRRPARHSRTSSRFLR